MWTPGRTLGKQTAPTNLGTQQAWAALHQALNEPQQSNCAGPQDQRMEAACKAVGWHHAGGSALR